MKTISVVIAIFLIIIFNPIFAQSIDSKNMTDFEVIMNKLDDAVGKLSANVADLKITTDNLDDKIEDVSGKVAALQKTLEEKDENISVYGKPNEEPVFVKILKELHPETALDWVLLFSGAATVFLVAIVWMQTSTTRKESNTKLRPWIRIEDVSYDKSGLVKLKNGKSVFWKDYWSDRTSMDPNEVSQIFVHSSIINGGATPSEKTRTQSFYSENKINKTILRDRGKKLLMLPLMPSEEQKWAYVFDPSTYLNSFKTSFYLAAECTYKVDKKTIHRLGKIWEMKGTFVAPIDYWFEEFKNLKPFEIEEFFD